MDWFWSMVCKVIGHSRKIVYRTPALIIEVCDRCGDLKEIRTEDTNRYRKRMFKRRR